MKTFEDRMDRALDEALELTFPASDPVAVYIPELAAAADRRRKASLHPLPLQEAAKRGTRRETERLL